ncbi:MAG: hypothetical protein AAFP68_16265 [Pseudomonadota bacterium]
MPKHAKSVMGISAPGPRPTPAALWVALRMIGLPLLIVLALIDVAIWAVVLGIWDICIGFWCWI